MKHRVEFQYGGQMFFKTGSK